MDLKFSNLIKGFFPVGRFWEMQENFTYLTNGLSDEFSRAYNKILLFHEQFNIVNSFELANEHGSDYLLRRCQFTKPEIQRIITHYVHGTNYKFKEAIEDFADFIGAEIIFLNPNTYSGFGVIQFGEEFGSYEPTAQNCQLFIQFGENVSCSQYGKIECLIKYLIPPYLQLTMSDRPNAGFKLFRVGTSKMKDKLGETIPCGVI